MKKLMTMMVASAMAAFAWADEEITMVEKEITQITVPFGIRGYTPSNKDVVRIEKTSDTALRLTALKSGRCDLEVRGDMDMTQKFQISVGGDLPKLLDTLQRELETVPEVHARILGDKIRIDGEIKSVKKWNYLTKVIKGYPAVRNFVEFTPGDDILVRMKESLLQSGFGVDFKPFAKDTKTWKANCVALAYSKVNRTMTVQAKVYTPEQQKQIMDVLKAEKRWLKLIDENDKEAFDDELQVKLNCQVIVDKPIVRISVAYMAIDEEDIKRIGNQVATVNEGANMFNIGSAVNALVSAFDITGQGHGDSHTMTASIGATLGVTTRFFKQNGITRISDTGYTLMESWDEKGATFKSGGTMFVRTMQANAGSTIMMGTADLKEIPYGFKIVSKGGLIDEGTTALDFDFELSSVMPLPDGTYDRKEDLSKQRINCPIGRTTLVSGIKKLVDENTPPSGLPILRNTPLLNWFVADSGKEVNDKRLMIMICPEIVDNTQDGNLKVNEEINIPLQKNGNKDTDEILEERKPFSGFWYWLNWFTF